MTKPKPPPFHRIGGLTRPEYEELKGLLENNGEGIYCFNGLTNEKRIVNAILFYRETYKKTLALVELLCDHAVPNGIPLAAYDILLKLRTKLERRWLYYLLDIPIRPPNKPRVAQSERYRKYGWKKNKAATLKLIDDFACEYVSLVFPDDAKLKLRVSENRRRWASKRLPGTKPLKRGSRRRR